MNQVHFHERYIPGKVEERVAIDHEQRYRFVSGRIRQGEKVLDAGCGVGKFSQMMAFRGGKVTGVDSDPDAVEYANRRYREHPDVSFYEVDLEEDYIAFERYNVITCMDVIEHVFNVEAVLKKFHAALIPGGSLWISSIDTHVRRHDKYANPHHPSEMSAYECRDALVRSGFDIINMYGQRPVRMWRTRRNIANKVLNRLFGRPEATADPRVMPWKSNMRYYLIHAKKHA